MLLFAAMIPPAVYASGESISWGDHDRHDGRG